jgi:hypothetical protein
MRREREGSACRQGHARQRRRDSQCHVTPWARAASRSIHPLHPLELRSVRTALRSPAHPWPQRNPMKSKGSRPGVKGPGCDGWGMSVDQLSARVAVDVDQIDVSGSNFDSCRLQ